MFGNRVDAVHLAIVLKYKENDLFTCLNELDLANKDIWLVLRQLNQ